jgi:glutathionylspermidine synthase
LLRFLKIVLPPSLRHKTKCSLTPGRWRLKTNRGLSKGEQSFVVYKKTKQNNTTKQNKTKRKKKKGKKEKRRHRIVVHCCKRKTKEERTELLFVRCCKREKQKKRRQTELLFVNHCVFPRENQKKIRNTKEQEFRSEFKTEADWVCLICLLLWCITITIKDKQPGGF